MAKKKKGKVVQMLSPENYIKQKARTLPIHECWVNEEWEENGLANIIVTRMHSNGNFTVGLYLIDLKCLGVKDTHYLFNIPLYEYREMLEKQNQSMTLEKLDYTLAHNIIFAGIEYALDYGFSPHKDFSISQYILEEDTDDIEIIEIECGDENGNPFYLRGPLDNNLRAKQIISQLEKTAGSGNYTFIDGREGTEWENKHFDENYSIVDDEDSWENDYDLEELLQFDHKEVINSKTYQFKIQIENISKPPVWRRITIPSYYRFIHFHYVIQAVFGWTDSHLFSFSPGGYGTSPEIQDINEDDDILGLKRIKNLDAKETILSDIFTKEGQKYVYIYDFGDNWHHNITLEKIIPEVSESPQCMDGKGACPPEDCGGVWGYEQFKEIMTDKNHPEYDEYKDWLGMEENETWDSGAFDLDEKRYMLKKWFKNS